MVGAGFAYTETERERCKVFVTVRKRVLALFAASIFLLVVFSGGAAALRGKEVKDPPSVEFRVSCPALFSAFEAGIALRQYRKDIHWYQLLALLASRHEGDFSRFDPEELREICSFLERGGALNRLTDPFTEYAAYERLYETVLKGIAGETEGGEYGLTAFFPLAAGFPFEHGDDFGERRTWGYDRLHLGHDILAETGTPVVASESGTVEKLGWNPYGGWRIGIRSRDRMRYYYYAHLQKDRPYAEGLQIGSAVEAGEVIGYVGQTGYSQEENVNHIGVSHLHWGLELIWDPEQREGEGETETWIDLYALACLLEGHRSPVSGEES